MNTCINTRKKRLNEEPCGICAFCIDPIEYEMSLHNCNASPFGDGCSTCEKYMQTFGTVKEAILL